MHLLMTMQHQLWIFALEIARLAAWLVLLTIIFVPLERWFAVRPGRILRAGWGIDLGYYFLSSLLPSLLLSLPLAAIGWLMHRGLPSTLAFTVAAWPLWLRIAAALVVGEAGFYWGHRLSHSIPWLWRFHAIHHSAEQLDWLVSSRAHPVDMVFGRLCGLVPLYVLGLASPLGRTSGLIPVLVLMLATIWGFFIHANIRWRFGPLEWLIATPGFHHWHHSRSGPRDRNFAPMLPWMDWLFGTLHLPRGAWPADYGIDTPMPRQLPAQLMYPLKH